eukprot:14192448-Ditylum_brightwellii.AAC.1
MLDTALTEARTKLAAAMLKLKKYKDREKRLRSSKLFHKSHKLFYDSLRSNSTAVANLLLKLISPVFGPAFLAAQQHIIMKLLGSKWKRKVYSMSPNNSGQTIHPMNYAGPYVKQRIRRHQEWT